MQRATRALRGERFGNFHFRFSDLPTTTGALVPRDTLKVPTFPELPADLAAAEDEIIRTVTEDLQQRGQYADTDPVLIRQYASAITEAARLTEEVRRWPSESQEFRRIAAARDRAQRNASSLATKLNITARSRHGEEKDLGASLLRLAGEPDAAGLAAYRAEHPDLDLPGVIEKLEEEVRVNWPERAKGAPPNDIKEEIRLAGLLAAADAALEAAS
jgi:hypothetical protein